MFSPSLHSHYTAVTKIMSGLWCLEKTHSRALETTLLSAEVLTRCVWSLNSRILIGGALVTVRMQGWLQ